MAAIAAATVLHRVAATVMVIVIVAIIEVGTGSSIALGSAHLVTSWLC